MGTVIFTVRQSQHNSTKTETKAFWKSSLHYHKKFLSHSFYINSFPVIGGELEGFTPHWSDGWETHTLLSWTQQTISWFSLNVQFLFTGTAKLVLPFTVYERIEPRCLMKHLICNRIQHLSVPGRPPQRGASAASPSNVYAVWTWHISCCTILKEI